MLDLLAFREEHRVFADVRGQIGNTFEVAADEEVLERRVDIRASAIMCVSRIRNTDSCNWST